MVPPGGRTVRRSPIWTSGVTKNQGRESPPAVYQTVFLETVRKVSEMSGAWPYGPPKRDLSAHFVVCIPAKLTAGALLRSLLGQFLSEGE